MTSPTGTALAPWPHYADDEIAAATQALRTGKVNYRTGPHGREFESAYAAALGSARGLAVSNGTVALEIAMHGLGLGPGDDVIVPARTFIATAAAVIRCGARPVVADIDRQSQNITADTIAAVLTPATKALIPVHLGGWPVDMAPIANLATVRKLKIVEDCAQSHGATLHGLPTGALGDVGCFSFCQDKIISTGGEGGMIVTNDEAIYRRMWSFREHGWDFEAAHHPDPNDGFRWLVSDFGTNARMTEVQSAIGQLQLGKLKAWVAQRRANALVLTEGLRKVPGIEILQPGSGVGHAYYRYGFLIEPAALKSSWSRNRILTVIDQRGVPARVGSCPDIRKERAFAALKMTPSNRLPNADWVAERSVVVPVHPTLTEAQLEFITTAVAAVMAEAVR